MPVLLLVHHSPSPSVQALTDAVAAGAQDDALEGVQLRVRLALEANAADVQAADGIVLGTSANFGYMSGALKHFFDSTFLAVGGALDDDGAAAAGSTSRTRPPFGLYVHGRYDTEGAVRSVLAITSALGWRQSAETLSVLGDVGDPERAAAYELGGTIAALIAQ